MPYKLSPVALLFSALLGHSAHLHAQDQEQAQDLEPDIEKIHIIGTRPERYRATDASSATAFNSQLKDIPRSIQVITEQIILDQQALDLEDVLKNVSGVQTISNFGNTTDSFIIRGFNVRTIFQDGYRLSNNITRVQTSNIERVEVVKGATALLYGQVQPGGLINVVTKRPKDEYRNFIKADFDEFGQRYLLGDFTGPVDKDGDLLYRLAGSIEDSDTFRETTEDAQIKRVNISPSVTWRVTDKDTLDIGFEFIESELPLDRGTVLTIDNNGERAIADIPRSRRLGEARDISDTSQVIARIDYQHEFNNGFIFDAIVRYQDAEAETTDSNVTAFGVPSTTLGFAPLPEISNVILATLNGVDAGLNPFGVPVDGQLLRLGFQVDSEEENLFSSIRFRGEQGRHQFAVGIDYNQRDSEFNNRFNTLSASETGLPLPVPESTRFLNFSAIDIFNPVYGQTSGTFTPNQNTIREDIQIGVYGQDLISLSEKWKLLVGLRWDNVDREDIITDFTTPFPDPAFQLIANLPANIVNVEDSGSESEVSPNAGVVYQPTQNVSFYASYSESFSPNFATNQFTGAVVAVDSREGQQFEAGVKGSYFDGLLSLNASYFDLNFTNAINGADPLTGAPIVNGEETSKGFEFDATVQFAKGINLIFNYANIDSEISRSENNQGNTPLGVPQDSANLWSTYEFTDGTLKGLGIGGGFTYVGDRFIDAANSFELDGYTTADITAWYYIDTGNQTQLRIQAGIRNLNDRRYFQAAQGTAFDINVGQPRTAYASIAFEF